MLEKQDLQQIETIMDKKFDEFAVIVRHGFDETHQRIDSTNQRIDEVNQRLSTRIDDLTVTVRDGFEEVHHRINETNQRIDRLTTAVDGFIVLYQKVDQEIVMLRSRMDRMEETIQQLQAQLAGAR